MGGTRVTFTLVSLGLTLAVARPIVPNPEEYVNILTGTQSRFDLSHGNILPNVVRPWGFNAWAPQTDNDGNYRSWWFHPDNVRFFGIRCTHQPSPWISDYGQFRIAAVVSDPDHTDPWQYTNYVPQNATWLPHHFKASLGGYGSGRGVTSVEVTSTYHGAVLKISFPPKVSGPSDDGWAQTRRIIFSLYGGQGDDTKIEGTTITGVSRQAASSTPGFGHYFKATLTGGPGADQDLSAAILNTATGDNNGRFAYIDFNPASAATEVITIRVATSLISPEQASVNHATEVEGRTFENVLAESKEVWNTLLKRVTVHDVGGVHVKEAEVAAQLTTFYSAIYRAAQFPRFLTETTEDGKQVHYSAYDGKGGVYDGVAVADSGFWDAYRTVYSWGAIVWPEVYADMVKGWVNAFKEGGWLPKWSSPGYRGSMVGTMGDVSLADAIVKNLPGIDVEAAYEAIRKDAFQVPGASAGTGRTCLQSYLEDGYIARGAPIPGGGQCSEVVSRSLNYMLADYAISKAAAHLNKLDDAAVLASRAANYTKLFEPKTGFFRSRAQGHGNFTEPFDQYAWGRDYTEAGPWQYRFYVPHDPKGLAALYKANGLDMCDLIEEAQLQPGTFHIGGYGTEIHEMFEMNMNCWGQYEHNNQPVHHMLWMFLAADSSVRGKCANRGQYWLRQVTSLLYRPGADFAAGDEDNGQLATWYLLSALGLYSLVPGTDALLLGSPIFGEVSVDLPNNKQLRIVAKSQCPKCVYVDSVTWNGNEVAGTEVDYKDLMKGGTLQFRMSATPASGVRGGPNPRGAELEAEVALSRQQWHSGRKALDRTSPEVAQRVSDEVVV